MIGPPHGAEWERWELDVGAMLCSITALLQLCVFSFWQQCLLTGPQSAAGKATHLPANKNVTNIMGQI